MEDNATADSCKPAARVASHQRRGTVSRGLPSSLSPQQQPQQTPMPGVRRIAAFLQRFCRHSRTTGGDTVHWLMWHGHADADERSAVVMSVTAVPQANSSGSFIGLLFKFRSPASSSWLREAAVVLPSVDCRSHGRLHRQLTGKADGTGAERGGGQGGVHLSHKRPRDEDAAGTPIAPLGRRRLARQWGGGGAAWTDEAHWQAPAAACVSHAALSLTGAGLGGSGTSSHGSSSAGAGSLAEPHFGAQPLSAPALLPGDANHVLFPSLGLADHAARNALPTQFVREQVDGPAISSASLYRWRAVYKAGEAHWDLTPLDTADIAPAGTPVRLRPKDTQFDGIGGDMRVR